MKKALSILLALLCTLSLLTGCAVTEQPPETTEPVTQSTTEPITEPATEPVTEPESLGKIGISMPTNDLCRWSQCDDDLMKRLLEEKGYEVTLMFGANEVATQVTQIENMIADGCKLLIIAAIEGDSLGTVLAEAKKNGVTVIAYDRLIMNTANVDYYVTFDNFKIGVMQGEYIEDVLDLKNAEGPFNIEIVGGDPGDHNAEVFYNGEMSVLRPYIDSGKLVVLSGQTEFAEIATDSWSTTNAQARMENILSTWYQDQPLHAVCDANDSTAQGVANALAADYSHDIYPVITGQDCDIVSVKNMLAGKQAMSVFKRIQTLQEQTANMADDIMQGRTPEVNNTTYYDNGVKVVPAYLCTPVMVTLDNYREYLLDTGYYMDNQLA